MNDQLIANGVAFVIGTLLLILGLLLFSNSYVRSIFVKWWHPIKKNDIEELKLSAHIQLIDAPLMAIIGLLFACVAAGSLLNLI